MFVFSSRRRHTRCALVTGFQTFALPILGLSRDSQDRVTAEELHLIVAEASKSGVVEESERAIISGVVRLADRPVREVMTPRIDVDWIDVAADADAVRAKLLETPHTRLPVARGSVADIVGVGPATRMAGAPFRGPALDHQTTTARDAAHRHQAPHDGARRQ